MQNPDYHLTDSELLNKYGIGQCPSRGVLTMYVMVLYCVKNGYSIPIDEDRETLKDFFEDLLNRLPNNLGDALQNFLHLDVVCGTEELRWCYHLACDVPREEFLYEYPLILSVLCDQLHIPHDDLDRIKLEWAVKKHLCGAGIDYRYYTGSQDALSDFILGELIDLQYKPELVPQSSGVYDESLQIQVAEDWELNDYWDPAFCEENDVDVLRPRDFSEGLLHDLDRLYERGGFHAIFHYDEQISGNPFRCAVLKSLVENHFLEEVITDGHNIICVLGVYGGFDSVRYKFFNGTEIVDLEDVPNPVHYSFIEANEYFLYPSFYTDEKIDDEREFVALGEICDVDPNCMEELINDSKTYHTLPRYYFSNDLQEVFSNAESPKHYKVSMLLDVYRGPHLHINRKGDLILNKVAGYYMCPEEYSWALRIKDDMVSPEYLSYVIHHSENIRNKLTAFPPTEVLLKIKVPILKDRRKQDELISEYREKISSVVNTDAVYSVAVVGLTDCSDSDFSSFLQGIVIRICQLKAEGGQVCAAHTGSVAGNDALYLICPPAFKMLGGFQSDQPLVAPCDAGGDKGAFVKGLGTEGAYGDLHIAHLQTHGGAEAALRAQTHLRLTDKAAVTDATDKGIFNFDGRAMEVIGLAAQTAGNGSADTGLCCLPCHLRIIYKAVGAGNIFTEQIPQQMGTVTGSAAAGVIGAVVNEDRAFAHGKRQLHRLLGGIFRHSEILPATPCVGGQLPGMPVSRFLGFGNGDDTDAAIRCVGIGEALEEAGLQQLRILLLAAHAKLLHIVGRTGGGDTLGRHHQPRQLDQSLTGLVATPDAFHQQPEHDSALVVLVNVGVVLAAHQQIGIFHHPVCYIAVKIQHHTDGNIHTHLLPDGLQDRTLRIGKALCRAAAVHKQGNAVIGLGPVGFVKQLRQPFVDVGNAFRITGTGGLAPHEMGADYLYTQGTGLVNEAANVGMGAGVAADQSIPLPGGRFHFLAADGNIAEKIGFVAKATDGNAHIAAPLYGNFWIGSGEYTAQFSASGGRRESSPP